MTIHVFAAGTVELHSGESPGVPTLAPAAGTVVVYTGGHDVELHEAAPADDIGVLKTRALNPVGTIWPRELHNGGGYTRNVRNVELPRAAGVEIQWALDQNAAAYQAASYTVMCGDVPVGSFLRPTSKYAVSIVDLSGIEDGCHLFDLVPSDGSETAVPFWMFVGNVNVATQTWAPAAAGSYSLSHKSGFEAKWVKNPARLDPHVAAVGYPLAPRAFMPMTGHPSYTQMFRRNLTTPTFDGDPAFLYTTKSGLRTCMAPHGYALGIFFAPLPGVPLLDGPRGVGVVVGAMHLQIGRRGGIYGLDAWRMFHVDPTGHVKTLFGYRHGHDGLELVGDWSAIPAERHGCHELWGLAWDTRTTAEGALDTSVLLDRGDGVMEHPHSGNPTAFVTDTQNNRVLRVEFDGRSHAKPPKITEHITGLNDPWDIVYYDGLLYVSERLAHRIAVYDADTGAYVRTLLQGAPLSGVASNRTVVTFGTLEQRRAEPCVGPEGLFRLGDWLYFGSRATQQVKRINLDTEVVEWVCDPYFDISPNGSSFCKIAVRSDGTVFSCTWENGGKGGPRANKPDGTVWKIQSTASSNLSSGRGGNYAMQQYNTACAVDNERIICAGAGFGLVELSLALDTDPPLWDKTLYEAGQSQYEREGYRLTHGADGFGLFGFPLPWGKSAAMDYYLAYHGHQPA